MTGPFQAQRDLGPLDGLPAHLERWLQDGVITPDQAAQITAEEQRLGTAAARPRRGATSRTSLRTEALGYVGAMLVVTACVLLAAQFWSDLSHAARMALVGSAVLLLLATGAALPARPGSVGERLRSLLWLLSAAAMSLLLGVLAGDVLGWSAGDTALLATSGTALYGAALWRASRCVLQQVVVFVALAATAASGLARLAPTIGPDDGLPGLGVLAVGGAWLYLGARELLAPRRLVLVLGGSGAALGASMTQMTGWGRVLAVGVVSCLVLLALRLGDLGLLVVATVAMFLVLPNVLITWFPGTVAAPLALLLTGSLLVLAALRSLRRGSGRDRGLPGPAAGGSMPHPRGAPGSRPRHRSGPTTLAGGPSRHHGAGEDLD